MLKVIQGTTIGGIEEAVNDFLEDNASAHAGTTIVKENGFYYAFVDYTEASGD